MAVQPIPAGYHTVTPYLCLRDTAKALDFYGKAFGAEELFRMAGPGGGVMHAEMKIGDSMIMLGDECPQRGVLGPQSRGGTTVSLMLYVTEVDAAFNRAVAAGCTVKMPPTNMFWGDRFCKVADPFGHEWAIATHIEDLSPEEVEKRGKEAMKEWAAKPT